MGDPELAWAALFFVGLAVAGLVSVVSSEGFESMFEN